MHAEYVSCTLNAALMEASILQMRTGIVLVRAD
jgi:hypothetical protein